MTGRRPGRPAAGGATVSAVTGRDDLGDFRSRTFTADGRTRTVFEQGAGPPVIVIHEMPGLTPEAAGFARRLVEHGFRVALPSLFGEPGRPMGAGYVARQLAWGCVSAEFAALRAGRTSPITRWLRALARDLHTEGDDGVGVVGMCFTGGFGLAMMLEPCVVAPVLSQPSLPLLPTPRCRRDVGLSPDDLAVARDRARAGVSVLGLRFTHDPVVPAARFERLRAELGERFESIEIDSGPGNPWGIPRRAHSVLTFDLVDEPGHPTRAALERVLTFLGERLHPA